MRASSPATMSCAPSVSSRDHAPLRRSTSRLPWAIVIGVSISCETSDRNTFWRSSAAAFSRASDSATRIACWRRCAWKTIARNISDISGTSVSSGQPSRPAMMARRVMPPVVMLTNRMPSTVRELRQTRNP